ncbi:MAG: UDP-N-acetylglucosamine--N-acetylmuramyl-(pentapeptide) pyrophosphoryl-undecaprenol N-acetylglucosamine transferase [Solobacterium sp.]|nr:UDP-N-acetylglucosamine--N-acetylmuramyl-(pentapeptide) pyrophosphoryl-undecaprenol N-acetylglucosamine transferase [Solobacterium sp.]
MIATGGTGGHIYPATALTEILKKKYPETEIVFFGSSNRMEAELIPSLGYRFHGMPMTGMNGGVRAKMKSALSMVRGERACRKLLAQEKPDICVGFGNYISVPLILAARRMHIPTMIHEQNSYAGKANAMLGRYADAIVGCYETSLKQFPAGKTRLYGNPEATLAYEKQADPSLKEKYGLDPQKLFAVFMMGSLGSSSVSRIIDEACALFDDYQVLIAAGKSNDYEFRNAGKENIHLVPYVDGVQMLKQADAAVVRAGATTMCEISAIGVPCILIPSPYVPNNHQVMNALELVNRGAAVMIEEKDLNAQSLSKALNELMADHGKREKLAAQAKLLGKTDAAYRMIEWMEELCGNG